MLSVDSKHYDLTLCKYLQRLNSQRFKGIGPKVTNIDSPQNAILVSSDLHSRMKNSEVAFLLLTPQGILQPTDIPDGPPAVCYPIREVTKTKLIKVLGLKAVDEEFAKEATASANHLIFQHLVGDIRDHGHPHNTRARVPRTNAPAPYLLDFHYITLILMQWGSEDVLGHRQPLRRTSVHDIYYDSPASVDSDSDNESDAGRKFIFIGKDGESEVEDEMDDEDSEDNSDEGGWEDPEKGDDQDDSKMDDDFSNGDNTETERASEQKGGTTEQQDETESINSGKSTPRPSTPDCDMQPAMDYLLSWTTRKPLMEHSMIMIEAWANEVVGQS